MESLGRSWPDAAVLDAVLRDGSSLELALEMIRPGVPFVMYSGRDKHRAGEAEFGGVPWIVKPSPTSSVVEAVRAALGRGSI